MGLLEVELKEMREHRKHFLAGKLSSEQVNTLVALYSQSEKRTRLIYQVECLRAKYGAKYQNHMMKTNLIGNGTVIDLSPEEIEEEKILCPHKDVHVTRSECLDFSGTAENMDTCAGCDEGIANKRLLVGDTPLFTA